MRSRLLACVLLVSIVGTLASFTTTWALAATTWYVDRGNAACDDAGPGNVVTPFCSVQSGAQLAQPGDTVLVRPATYREQVTPPASGSTGAPIVYRAGGPGVVLLGTLAVSDHFAWTQVSGEIWKRSFEYLPRQVFVDGVRLAGVTSLSAISDHSFYYDPVEHLLYVDLGGPNPGLGHVVEAGAFTYGFNLAGRSNLVIDGFTLKAQNSVGIRTLNSSAIAIRNLEISSSGTYGIRIEASTGPVTVEGCDVSAAASNGILLLNTTGVTVRNNSSHDNGFHGISLQGSGENLVISNTCYRNVDPEVRSAAGINLNEGSEDNEVFSNTTYENQDSGIEVYNGSDRNLLARNVSWGNGDHGFDSSGVNRTRFVSNTAYANYKDGFSIEDGSNITLFNNIGVDNGLLTHEFNLYADQLALEGFSSDYNIFWNSTPGTTLQYDNINYETLEEFSLATGNEAHGLGVDPLFMDPSGLDFRLAQGSPAIDSADATVPGFQLADHDGRQLADDPDAENQGPDDPAYADRGAYENEPAPTVIFQVTPPAGVINFTVQVDASQSRTYTGGPVSSYSFDFGDGTIVGPQASPLASHTYTSTGIYSITVSATDRLTASASTLVIAYDEAPTVVLTLTPSPKNSQIVTVDASHSTDDDAAPIVDFRFNFGDGTTLGPQASPIATHKYKARGSFRITVTVTDSEGLSSKASALVNTKDRFSNLRFAGAASAAQPPSSRFRSR